MQFYLKDSAVGTFSGREYAVKGTLVTLIAEHGNMVVVDSGKEKFSVKASMLSEVQVDQEPVNVVKEEVKIHSGRSKGVKKKPSVNVKAQSLF